MMSVEAPTACIFQRLAVQCLLAGLLSERNHNLSQFDSLKEFKPQEIRTPQSPKRLQNQARVCPKLAEQPAPPRRLDGRVNNPIYGEWPDRGVSWVGLGTRRALWVGLVARQSARAGRFAWHPDQLSVGSAT
jgi:hypothetical protein